MMLFLIKGDYYNIIQRILKIQFIYLRELKPPNITYKR
jgi:hypothetical protein